MLEMVIVARDGHQFLIRIKSIVEAPVIGASIECGVCKKETTVLRKGIPHRLNNSPHPIDKNQTSMKE